MVFMACQQSTLINASTKGNEGRWKQNKIKSKFIALNKWPGRGGEREGMREREREREKDTWAR